MQVAICGLGRMGAGMARRAARGGHDVVVWNRTETVANEIAGEAENEGRVTVAEPIERLVELMAAPRHVVISVPSGEATEAMTSAERDTADQEARDTSGAMHDDQSRETEPNPLLREGADALRHRHSGAAG